MNAFTRPTSAINISLEHLRERAISHAQSRADRERAPMAVYECGSEHIIQRSTTVRPGMDWHVCAVIWPNTGPRNDQTTTLDMLTRAGIEAYTEKPDRYNTEKWPTAVSLLRYHKITDQGLYCSCVTFAFDANGALVGLDGES